MKVFIDTGPIVAFFNRDDALHEDATRVFSALSSGSPGFPELFIFHLGLRLRRGRDRHIRENAEP